MDGLALLGYTRAHTLTGCSFWQAWPSDISAYKCLLPYTYIGGGEEVAFILRSSRLLPCASISLHIYGCWFVPV